ncbi:hypothetical protein [Pseudomonas sp. Root562]|uniref:hypothetical protein n=1 Tax=Pseudomonas sp. Root562 TaxID=1736561 RepID=UPI000702F2C9|nr:hypothetical protein [Pseudomonas sp. Root562]KQZ80654.1 hypothetical protein ASD60_15075 [Pseudomonas sp. Root562]
MSDIVVVRFLKAWRGYSVDELAGFGADVAEGLKSKGFAELYEGEVGQSGKQKSGKTSTAKSGAAKSGGKSSAVSLPDDNTSPPPADGEGGDDGAGNEGGEGGAGEGGSGADDEEKP